jgi:hypothetical protein
MAAIDYTADIVAFLRAMVPVEGAYGPQMLIPPFMEAFLRRAFPMPEGHPAERNILDSRSKKQGKTALAAGVALYLATRKPYSEVVIAAADKDQAKDRVLRAAKYAVEHGALGRHAKVFKDVIEFDNKSIIQALPQDWAGAAGGNYAGVIFDELHVYTYDYQTRLYDELVIPPTQPNGVRWVSTYAGWEGESKLLKEIWDRAQAGQLVEADPPTYHNTDAAILALIDQGEGSWRMPWTQGDAGRKFMTQQQASERPNVFRRLWLNEWVNAESQFVEMESWDALLDPELRPALPGAEIVLAGDAAIKHDCAALVGCTYNHERKRVELALVRVWNPKQLGRLDPDKTIGDEVRSLKGQGYRIRAFYADPWQMETTMQSLKQAGIAVSEFPQTTQRTEADMALWTAITSRALATYTEPTLRQHIQNAVAVEGPRGMRLAKEKTSQKIDAAVALSMAHWGAVQLLAVEPAVLHFGPNPFYGGSPLPDVPPSRQDPALFDKDGWWKGKHREGVTWTNCRHRNTGCHACKAELQPQLDERKREYAEEEKLKREGWIITTSSKLQW